MTVKLFASGTQQRLGTSASTETFVSFTVPTSAGAVSTTGATGVTAAATVSGSPATNTDIAITIPMDSATIINATTVDRIAIETS